MINYKLEVKGIVYDNVGAIRVESDWATAFILDRGLNMIAENSAIDCIQYCTIGDTVSAGYKFYETQMFTKVGPTITTNIPFFNKFTDSGKIVQTNVGYSRIREIISPYEVVVENSFPDFTDLPLFMWAVDMEILKDAKTSTMLFDDTKDNVTTTELLGNVLTVKTTRTFDFSSFSGDIRSIGFLPKLESNEPILFAHTELDETEFVQPDETLEIEAIVTRVITLPDVSVSDPFYNTPASWDLDEILNNNHGVAKAGASGDRIYPNRHNLPFLEPFEAVLAVEWLNASDTVIRSFSDTSRYIYDSYERIWVIETIRSDYLQSVSKIRFASDQLGDSLFLTYPSPTTTAIPNNTKSYTFRTSWEATLPEFDSWKYEEPPIEYTPNLGMRSVGHVSVDLGYNHSVTEHLIIELDAQICSLVPTGQVFLGNSTMGVRMNTLWTSFDTTVFPMLNSFADESAGGYMSTEAGIADTRRHIYKSDGSNGSLWRDSTEFTPAVVRPMEPGASNVHLYTLGDDFTRRVENHTEELIIYHTRVWQSNALVRDMYPVIQGDARFNSTPAPINCFWDAISRSYMIPVIGKLTPVTHGSYSGGPISLSENYAAAKGISLYYGDPNDPYDPPWFACSDAKALFTHGNNRLYQLRIDMLNEWEGYKNISLEYGDAYSSTDYRLLRHRVSFNSLGVIPITDGFSIETGFSYTSREDGLILQYSNTIPVGGSTVVLSISPNYIKCMSYDENTDSILAFSDDNLTMYTIPLNGGVSAGPIVTTIVQYMQRDTLVIVNDMAIMSVGSELVGLPLSKITSISPFDRVWVKDMDKSFSHKYPDKIVDPANPETPTPPTPLKHTPFQALTFDRFSQCFWISSNDGCIYRLDVVDEVVVELSKQSSKGLLLMGDSHFDTGIVFADSPLSTDVHTASIDLQSLSVSGVHRHGAALPYSNRFFLQEAYIQEPAWILQISADTTYHTGWETTKRKLYEISTNTRTINDGRLVNDGIDSGILVRPTSPFYIGGVSIDGTSAGTYPYMTNTEHPNIARLVFGASIKENDTVKSNLTPVQRYSTKFSSTPAPCDCFWDTVSEEYNIPRAGVVICIETRKYSGGPIYSDASWLTTKSVDLSGSKSLLSDYGMMYVAYDTTIIRYKFQLPWAGGPSYFIEPYQVLDISDPLQLNSSSEIIKIFKILDKYVVALLNGEFHKFNLDWTHDELFANSAIPALNREAITYDPTTREIHIYYNQLSVTEHMVIDHNGNVWGGGDSSQEYDDYSVHMLPNVSVWARYHPNYTTPTWVLSGESKIDINYTTPMWQFDMEMDTVDDFIYDDESECYWILGKKSADPYSGIHRLDVVTRLDSLPKPQLGSRLGIMNDGNSYLNTGIVFTGATDNGDSNIWRTKLDTQALTRSDEFRHGQAYRTGDKPGHLNSRAINSTGAMLDTYGGSMIALHNIAEDHKVGALVTLSEALDRVELDFGTDASHIVDGRHLYVKDGPGDWIARLPTYPPSGFGLYGATDPSDNITIIPGRSIVSGCEILHDEVSQLNLIPVQQYSLEYSTTPAPSDCFWDSVAGQYVELSGGSSVAVDNFNYSGERIYAETLEIGRGLLHSDGNNAIHKASDKVFYIGKGLSICEYVLGNDFYPFSPYLNDFLNHPTIVPTRELVNLTALTTTTPGAIVRVGDEYFVFCANKIFVFSIYWKLSRTVSIASGSMYTSAATYEEATDTFWLASANSSGSLLSVPKSSIDTDGSLVPVLIHTLGGVSASNPNDELRGLGVFNDRVVGYHVSGSISGWNRSDLSVRAWVNTDTTRYRRTAIYDAVDMCFWSIDTIDGHCSLCRQRVFGIMPALPTPPVPVIPTNTGLYRDVSIASQNIVDTLIDYEDLHLTRGYVEFKFELDIQSLSTDEGYVYGNTQATSGVSIHRYALRNIFDLSARQYSMTYSSASEVVVLFQPLFSYARQLISGTNNSEFSVDGNILANSGSAPGVTMFPPGSMYLFGARNAPGIHRPPVVIYGLKIFGKKILGGPYTDADLVLNAVAVLQGDTYYSSTPAPANGFWDGVSQSYLPLVSALYPLDPFKYTTVYDGQYLRPDPTIRQVMSASMKENTVIHTGSYAYVNTSLSIVSSSKDVYEIRSSSFSSLGKLNGINNVKGIASDRSTRIWMLQTNDILVQRDVNTGNESTPYTMGLNVVGMYYSDLDGMIWVLSSYRTLFTINPNTWVNTNPAPGSVPVGLGTLTGIVVTETVILISTLENMIYALDKSDPSVILWSMDHSTYYSSGGGIVDMDIDPVGKRLILRIEGRSGNIEFDYVRLPIP